MTIHDAPAAASIRADRQRAAVTGTQDGPPAADGPSIARVYDYLLGGSHNFAADRASAQDFLARWPDAQLTMLANRAFLGRAVRLPASPRFCKWFCGGPVYGSGRASVCSLALIAAGSCERAAGSGGAERPRSGAAGALDTAAREQIMGCGGKGANRGSAVSGLAWGLSCWGPG